MMLPGAMPVYRVIGSRQAQCCLRGPSSVVGFTLLEVMVALAIFSLLSTACYQFLNSLSHSRKALLAASAERSHLEKARLIIEQDLRHAVPRSVRQGDEQKRLPALIGRVDGILEFSRCGLPLRESLIRTGSGRVIYRIDDVEGGAVLTREVYRVLDRAATSPGESQVLVRGATNMKLRFMTATGRWVSTWPPGSQSDNGRLNRMPTAVEISLNLADSGEYIQTISLR